MIQLKFISSPDEDIKGEGTWFLNSLWIGRSKKAKILIDDPGCSLMHIHISVTEQGAFCDLGPKAPQFHVGGKKIVGRKLIKAGDKIKIGSTEIQLVKYQFEVIVDARAQLEKCYLDLVKSSPGHQAVLDRIEKEILAIERELHA